MQDLSQESTRAFDQNPAATPKKNKKRGCLIAALIAIAIVIIAIVAVVVLVNKGVCKLAEEYKAKGYDIVTQQSVQLAGGESGDKVFVVQTFQLDEDYVGNLVILAQSATIGANVEGNVIFTGQTIRIDEDAIIAGDLEIGSAQAVHISGIILGKISANCQTITLPADMEDRATVNCQSKNIAHIERELETEGETTIDSLSQ